jgi:hypothetical protein
MRRISRVSWLGLLALAAGLPGCQRDSMDRLEKAEERALDHAAEQEVAQAELIQRQTAEQESLVHKQVQEEAKAPAEPGAVAESQHELAQKQANERADLGEEQRAERADLREDVAAQRQKDTVRLSKASEEATEQKQAFAEKSRERLHKLEARASQLGAKRKEAEPQEQAIVNEALMQLPSQCQQVEHEIAALEAVSTGAQWERAKGSVLAKLSSIERSLDRVDRLL